MSLDHPDTDLVEAARAVLRKHYRPHWHTVAAAIRSSDGRVWTGLHLGTTVGRLAVCAEAVALGRAILEGDGTVACAVAVRHPKAEELVGDIAVVAPCGACREMFIDHAPAAAIIMPAFDGPVRMAVRDLLPQPYRREAMEHIGHTRVTRS